ncbi:acidic leucine-rich nuclear phosphoprotein 32 family member A-like [Atheta coriaria]|uniref:acidic leucine-rich nuclear phosphoprotein 32 family member A-like n=1 Tax=Dalotia coriaria TaxID=877792 RepID=UPI0031F42FFF
MEINCLHDNPRAAKQIVHAPASSLRLMHEVIFDVVAPRMNRKFVRTFSGFGFTKNSEEYEQLRRRIYEKFSVKKLTTACNMLDIDDSGNKDEMCDRVCEVLRDLNNLKTYQLPEDDSNDEEDDDDEENNDDDDGKDDNDDDDDGKDDNDDDEDADDDVTLQHLRQKMLRSCDRKNLDSRAKIKDDDQSRRSQRRKKSSTKVCEEKKKLRIRYEDDDEFEPRGSTSKSKFTLSFRDVEDMVRPFTGEDAYGIETWTEEYEEIADMLNLNALQKLIFAKKCLKGPAKKFVQSEIGLNSWRNLKDALKDEFGDQLSGADVHKKMMSRKILQGNQSKSI